MLLLYSCNHSNGINSYAKRVSNVYQICVFVQNELYSFQNTMIVNESQQSNCPFCKMILYVNQTLKCTFGSFKTTIIIIIIACIAISKCFTNCACMVYFIFILDLYGLKLNITCVCVYDM